MCISDVSDLRGVSDLRQIFRHYASLTVLAIDLLFETNKGGLTRLLHDEEVEVAALVLSPAVEFEQVFICFEHGFSDDVVVDKEGTPIVLVCVTEKAFLLVFLLLELFFLKQLLLDR